jgi:hypothetical protein
MKRFFTLLVCWAMHVAPVRADVVIYHATGETVVLRFDDVDDTEVTMTEGSVDKLGRYVATDANLVTAGLDAGTYSARAYIGTIANTVAVVPTFNWSGTVELPPDAQFNERGRRIWYLAASGGSDSNPGTDSLPLETPAAAISAASEGDTIFFKPGVYAMSTTQIDVNKRGLTLLGAPGSVTITSSVFVVGAIKLSDGTTLDGLNIENTDGLAFIGQNVTNITVKRCICSGWQDACGITNFNNGGGVCHFQDSRFISQQDVIVLFGMRSARINRCSMFTNGTISTGGALPVRGINAAGSTVANGGAPGVLTIEDCDIEVAIPASGHSLTSGASIVGVYAESNSNVTVRNSLLRIRNLASGLSAVVSGVVASNISSDGTPPPAVHLETAEIVTSNANAAGVYDLLGKTETAGAVGYVTANSSCRMDGGAKIGANAVWDRETIDATKTRVQLALPPISPSANGGLPTGNASNQVLALDGSGNAIAPASAVATAQADLDIITGTDGATLATSQGLYAPAKVADVPTAVQVRTEIDSNSTQLAKLGTPSNLGTGANLAANAADLAGTGFVSATHSLKAQGDNILEIQSGSSADPTFPDKADVWVFNSATRLTANNTIVETTEFDALLGLNLDGVLDKHLTVAAVISVTISGTPATKPVLGTATITTDYKQINIPCDCTAADTGDFVVTVTYRSSDNQVKSRKGNLTIQ